MLSSMFGSMLGGAAPQKDANAPTQPAVIKQLVRPADPASHPSSAPAAATTSEADELVDDEMD